MDFCSASVNPEEFEDFDDLSNFSGCQWLDLDTTDICDETRSLSSFGSTRDESISSSHFGSTCSSPCKDDSDVPSVFDYTDDFPISNNPTWPSDLGDLNIVLNENSPPQAINPTDLPLQSGNPLFMWSDRQSVNDESLLGCLDFLKLMDITSNQQSQISYLNTNTSFGNYVESSGLRPFALKCWGQVQQQQQQDQEPLSEQKPQFLKMEIKQEEFSNDESTVSDNKKQQKGSPTKTPSTRKKRKYERRATARKTIQLYEFMLRLLDQKDDSVTWVSREDGVFKLLKSKGVAQMWGKYKKNDNMTYESLSRALRHYYAQEILVPVPKKLHYKFCKKTLDNWYKRQLSY